MLPYVKFAAKILYSNYSRLSLPYKLTWAVTYWCNYRCKMCNIWQRKPKDELTFDEVKTFFTRNTHFHWIHLTGGEPFLRKDFIDICELIVKTNKELILLNFPTNGYLTDKIVPGIARLMKSSPRRLFITISMDGDEELNDEIRGIQGGWRRQLETFKGLRKIKGVQVVLGMTLSQYNLHAFERAFQAVKKEIPDLTYNDFHINIVHTSSHYYGKDELSEIRPPSEELIQEVETYRKKRKGFFHPVHFLEHEYLRLVKKYIRTGQSPIHCHALRSSMFMDSWGNVYPCITYNRKVGNIRDAEYDLRLIWDSQEAHDLQRQMWELRCPQCWTPCEAYQSILGTLFRIRKSPRKKEKHELAYTEEGEHITNSSL